MTKAVCGLVDAPADFDERFGKVGVNLSDKFGSLGFGRLMTGHNSGHSWGRKRKFLRNWTDRGSQVKPLEKFFDSLMSSAGFGSCAPAHTTDVKRAKRICSYFWCSFLTRAD